jgi:hypothetical protein
VVVELFTVAERFDRFWLSMPGVVAHICRPE